MPRRLRQHPRYGKTLAMRHLANAALASGKTVAYGWRGKLYRFEPGELITDENLTPDREMKGSEIEVIESG